MNVYVGDRVSIIVGDRVSRFRKHSGEVRFSPGRYTAVVISYLDSAHFKIMKHSIPIGVIPIVDLMDCQHPAAAGTSVRAHHPDRSSGSRRCLFRVAVCWKSLEIIGWEETVVQNSRAAV